MCTLSRVMRMLRQQKWQQCDGTQRDCMGLYTRESTRLFGTMGLYRTVWDAAPRPPKPQVVCPIALFNQSGFPSQQPTEGMPA